MTDQLLLIRQSA